MSSVTARAPAASWLDRLGADRAGSAALGVAIGLAAFGTLKVYVGAPLHWLLVLASLGLALGARTGGAALSALREAAGANRLRLIPWLAFIAAIALAWLLNAGSYAAWPLALSSMGKFALLAGALLVLLAVRPDYRQLERAFAVVLVLSAALFALTCLSDWTVIRLGDGRLGWFGAWPGVFWKTAIFAWPFLAWRMLDAPGWNNIALAGLAAALVALDGSRSGLLALAAVLVALTGLFLVVRRQTWRATLRNAATLALALGFAYLAAQPFLLRLFDAGGPMRLGAAALVLLWAGLGMAGLLPAFRYRRALRFGAVALVGVFLVGSASSISLPVSGPPGAAIPHAGPTLDRITSTADPRLGMIQSALDGIAASFPFGSGLGSTTGDDHGTPAHVHVTPLQLLSDLGVIGLAAYLAIFAVSLGALRHPGWATSPTVPVGLAMLGIYLLVGLFAPFSNEVSEWLPVLVATALLAGPGAPPALSTPPADP